MPRAMPVMASEAGMEMLKTGRILLDIALSIQRLPFSFVSVRFPREFHARLKSPNLVCRPRPSPQVFGFSARRNEGRSYLCHLAYSDRLHVQEEDGRIADHFGSMHGAGHPPGMGAF